MIINLKNSKNLNTNDIRNSHQVQWWYIHEFYIDSLSFAVLSLVNSSLEQTHRSNIAYYLDNQYHTLKNQSLKKSSLKNSRESIPSNFWVLHSEWVPKELLWSIPETLQQQPQQQHSHIVNELKQDVQYFQGDNLSKNWYIKLVKKVKTGINMPRVYIS